jgi:cysteine desulfurase/selenocysteine lyase
MTSAPPVTVAPPIPRAEFPVTERYRYLNHAGVAPLPRVAVEAGRRFLEDQLHHGVIHAASWEAEMEGVRTLAGGLLGVPAADIAFVKNTTEGLAFVANGLDWRPGDRVLAADRDFPSSVYPWLALRDRGVRVDLLPPTGEAMTWPLDAFADALAAVPTRLVAVSWVHFGRGWRIDLPALAALCHEHGALLCVDAIQGLGVIPADLAAWGVDFAAADAHKWLLGPQGTGVLYVPERHRDRLRPQEPGWASVANRHDYDHLALDWHPSARRYEGGSHTVETIVQMGAAMELLRSSGIERVWDHVRGLLDRAAVALTEAGATVVSDLSPAHRGAHLTFTLPGWAPADLARRLGEARIVVAPRGGGIRVAPHGYNDGSDLDALVEAVGGLVR